MDNSLSGPIPNELGGLTALTELCVARPLISAIGRAPFPRVPSVAPTPPPCGRVESVSAAERSPFLSRARSHPSGVPTAQMRVADARCSRAHHSTVLRLFAPPSDSLALSALPRPVLRAPR